MRLAYHVLDVFTDTRFGGNPLAVVLAADDLDGARMQTIAREFNLSETVFVLEPQNKLHTARVRIFTPTSELPFAGHPTVGTAALLAELKSSSPAGAGDALVVLEAPIGTLRVGVRMRADAASFAEFDAPKLPEESGALPSLDRLAAALSLIPAEIGFENHRPTKFAAGNTVAFVPVASLEAIAKARVASHHWDSAMKGQGLLGVFLYCRQTVHTTSSFHARFGPDFGVPEAPSDRVGSGGVRGRHSPLRCAARRHAQARCRAGLRDGTAEPDLPFAPGHARHARRRAYRRACRAGGGGQNRGVKRLRNASSDDCQPAPPSHPCQWSLRSRHRSGTARILKSKRRPPLLAPPDHGGLAGSEEGNGGNAMWHRTGRRSTEVHAGQRRSHLRIVMSDHRDFACGCHKGSHLLRTAVGLAHG